MSYLKSSSLRRWARAVVPCLASAFCASPAFSQSAGESAEALYQRGIEAFDGGNYVVACRFLSESYRLDPQLGALFTEATCEMRAGRLATAAQLYLDFLTRVDSLPPETRERQQERRAVALEQRASLLRKIPTLRVELRGPAASGVQLTLNGKALPASSLGVDLPVDPGDQVLEQRAASGVVTMRRITLAPGEHQTLVVQLAGDAPPSAPHPAPAPSSAGRSALPFVLGGAGLVGVGVGSVAGVMALGQKGIVNHECEGTSCTQRGLDAVDAGKRDALVSTIGFAVGAVALTAGVVLYLSSSEPSRRSSALVVAGDRLLWRGQF